MEKIKNNSKRLNRLTWFCIIFGLIEIFVLIFISSSILAIIPGLITIIPAYISLIDQKIKWKYFVGIWALVKYNPITLALTSFIIADLFGSSINSNSYNLISFGLISLSFIGISSFVIGIFIIILTTKQIKLLKLHVNDETKKP